MTIDSRMPFPADDEAFGRILLERGRLDQAAYERGLRLCQASGERLHVVVSRLGMVQDEEVARSLAAWLRLPLARGADFPDAPVVEGISVRFMKEARVVPLADGEDGVALAMADPTDRSVIDAVRLATGREVRPWVGLPADIEAAIERLYGSGRSSLGQLIEEVGGPADDAAEDIERLKDLAGEAPVIRLVNTLIARAVEQRASDIHLEPYEGRLRARYRIDGVLREVEGPPGRLRAAVVSRIKIMARLNIAERRLPQDGRIKLAVRGKEIDLRVSTVPTMHGESVVMRILDRGSVALDLHTLGFGGDTLKRYREALARPNGILLVTGPTGSGKTTTLYASLIELNTPDRKILTVEDPIEYQLEGVGQIQVKPQIGLDFASVLRSLLRHDPDVMMVGEIRDLETAEIAVQAALTGHLVLSTLHTNSAAASVVRLLDMGVEGYLLTATVNGIVAQRLVRTLCAACRQAEEVLPELAEHIAVRRAAGDRPARLYRPGGCPACNGTGYVGRTTVAEMLPMTDAIRRLILRRADTAEIHRAAVAEGMTTMFEDGIAKALAGVTSLEEVLRVTREV